MPRLWCGCAGRVGGASRAQVPSPAGCAQRRHLDAGSCGGLESRTSSVQRCGQPRDQGSPAGKRSGIQPAARPRSPRGQGAPALRVPEVDSAASPAFGKSLGGRPHKAPSRGQLRTWALAEAPARCRASCTRALPAVGTQASATSTLRVTSTLSLFSVWYTAFSRRTCDGGGKGVAGGFVLQVWEGPYRRW
jgi:hypothetical protein